MMMILIDVLKRKTFLKTQSNKDRSPSDLRPNTGTITNFRSIKDLFFLFKTKISQDHTIRTMATTTGKRSNAVKRASSAVIHTARSLASAINSVEIPTSGYLKSGVVINTKEDTGEWNGKAMVIAGEDLDSLSISPLEIETATSRPWLAFLVDPSIRTGRVMILIAAAIYGTNFATVKLLDESIPLSVSVSKALYRVMLRS